MHDFDTGTCTPGRPERLEPEHGPRESFHGPMILFHNIIKEFGVANDDRSLVNLIVVLDRGGVAATLIDRDLLW